MGLRVPATEFTGQNIEPIKALIDRAFLRVWAAASTGKIEEEGLCCFLELDCLQALLPDTVLRAAEERAARLNMGADRVLIASGAIDEETYLQRLGSALNIQIETFDDLLRRDCPLSDHQMVVSAGIGLLPLTIGQETRLVLAPYGKSARWLVNWLMDRPALAHCLRLTSSQRLNRFILNCTSQTLVAEATDTLKEIHPELSAAPPRRLARLVLAISMLMLLVGASFFAFPVMSLALEILLALFFFSWTGLRLISVCAGKQKASSLLMTPDSSLPIYSVIAALYKEAASIDGLLNAIERLNYPPEKLDVILAVEADDTATRAAIEARKNRIPVTIVASPPLGPRTKPKALNMALPFARGAFTVVYDAEDRPEPDQLRCALQTFLAAEDSLVCVQARLCIDNTDDSWLTRFFTAEYAGHFDVFLSGLASMRLPLPLGGSSNHFRTAKLREIGAWDPYNVTEDADLGIRLARFGYRSDVISSTTYEEAPAQFGPWLRQRTRWLKGWIQTWVVHMRHPLRLKRELGIAGFIAFQFMVGGNVLAAMLHPLFVVMLILTPGWTSASAGHVVFSCASIVVGYLVSAFLGWIGLARRGLTATASVLILTPVHWLLLSISSWRAFYQFLFSPYGWEKTEHGLAKNSRRADGMARSLALLDQHLRDLKESGKLPNLPAERARVLGRRIHQTSGLARKSRVH